MAAINPLRLAATEAAETQIQDAENWLKSLPYGGMEAAARFTETIGRVLPALCQDIAERLTSGSNVPQSDEEASLAYSRPAYKYIFTTSRTGKRKKRQTAGVYVLFYTLPDTNTLLVLGLRHGAAEPLTAWLDQTNL